MPRRERRSRARASGRGAAIAGDAAPTPPALRSPVQQSNSAGLVVISEEDTRTLLIHRLCPDDIYQRQGGELRGGEGGRGSLEDLLGAMALVRGGSEAGGGGDGIPRAPPSFSFSFRRHHHHVARPRPRHRHRPLVPGCGRVQSRLVSSERGEGGKGRSRVAASSPTPPSRLHSPGTKSKKCKRPPRAAPPAAPAATPLASAAANPPRRSPSRRSRRCPPWPTR